MVERDPPPIAPDVALLDGLDERLPGAGRARDDRARPVRADDEAGALDLPLAARPAVPAPGHDAGDPAVALDQIHDTHAVAELSPGGDRSLGEHAVEQAPPGAVGVVAAVHRRRRALQHDAVQVDPPVGEGRRACRDLGQHAPAAQVGDAEGVDQVRRLPHVAGEAVAVEQQHAAALAGQQHRGGGAGAAGADDDRVVDGAPPPGRQPGAAGVIQPMKAPVPSLTTAKRPTPGTSKGARAISPPAASTRASRASMSSTAI